MRFWKLTSLSLLLVLSLQVLISASAEQCGSQAGGALCPSGLCCSLYGWCGSTPTYCGPGNCQSQCHSGPPPTTAPPPPSGDDDDDVASIITSSMFDEMLKHRDDFTCPGRGFYTYDAFIKAARSFPDFATTGDIDTRKRELAAFFAQTSHETTSTGGWAEAPDGPYAWGYCVLMKIDNPTDYCVPSSEWPCVPGRTYFGRGPIQISYNYNYGPCGQALGVNLLKDPDMVATDSVISFKSALWFWMTNQFPKPSCHDVITGIWQPLAADIAANRLPGFGLITNIINRGQECGHGTDPRVQSRIGFYKRYCTIFGVSPGDNLDCDDQTSFADDLPLETM